MLERVREYNLLLIPQRGSLFPMKKNKIYTFKAIFKNKPFLKTPKTVEFVEFRRTIFLDTIIKKW